MEILESIMSLGIVVVVVGIILLILGAIFIAKCVSMHNKSEKNRKYEKMMDQPLEKFGEGHADELAKKYDDKEGE